MSTPLSAAATGGQVKAAQAANNIDVNTGSAVAVQQGTRQAGYLNTETVMNNAELAAYGYRTQQRGFTEQAGLETMAAQEAPPAAGLATAGGEYAAAGAYSGSEGAMQAAEGSLLSSASGIGFKLPLSSLSSSSSSPGTGLAGASWALNFG